MFELWSLLLQVLSVAIVGYLVFYVFQLANRSDGAKRKGKRIPSLRGIPVLGNTLQYVKMSWPVKDVSPNVYTLQAFTGITQIFKKEGIFKVLLGPFRYYVIFSPKYAEALLKSNTFIDKPADYNLFEPWLGKGLVTSESRIWRPRRKLLTPTFHFKILDTFQPIMDEKSYDLVKKLRSFPNLDVFELSTQVELCTMDIICETAMGYKVNALDNHSSPFIRSLHHLGECVMKRMLSPWFWPNLIWKFSKPGKLFNESNAYVQNFIRKVISDRKRELLDSAKEDGERPAFLDLILRQHFQDPSFTEKNVLEEVNTFMFAGQDTTSAGMTWCFFLLGHHPDVQDKLAQELYEVFGEDKDRVITLDDLKELKYLECVIKEGQRMYPSVPVIGRYIGEDFWIDEDYMIPKGSGAAVLTRELCLNDDEAFPDPQLFKPERFSLENIKGRNPFVYVPFSAGPRNCIGQRFAILEMKTIMSNILRNFSVKSLDPIDQIAIVPEIVSRPSRKLKYELKPRVYKSLTM